MHYILLTVTVFSLALAGAAAQASDYPGQAPAMETSDAPKPHATHEHAEDEADGDVPREQEPASGGTSTKEAEACIDSSRNFPDAGGGSFGSRAMNKRRNCE